MPKKRLRAVFATDRIDHVKSWIIEDHANHCSGPIDLNFGFTSNLAGEPLVGVEGPAQAIMFAIGAVAAQGEDFLMSVLPC